MQIQPTTEAKLSTGNMTLVVLCDTRQPEYTHMKETVFSALEHFGMPYGLVDLARTRLSNVDLGQHAAVVIGQEHLGTTLHPSDTHALVRAVQEGLGLVSLDHNVFAYPEAFSEALALERGRPSNHPAEVGADGLIIADNGHFVAGTQNTGSTHEFKMPVPASLSRVRSGNTAVLAETTEGYPCVIAARIGQGRTIQWLISPKVWMRQYFGHAYGLDDLLWKGIVWVARKPFVMNAMPPFVRLRLDDCNGLWRDASDFRFVDVLNEFGHKPTLCLCMRAISDDGAGKIKQLHADSLAEFAPHTLSPNTGIFYGDERGEYSYHELQVLMEEVDSLFARWGIRPSRILSDHGHSYSSKVLPLLKERGISFKMNITLPDEKWTGPHVDWRPKPYGSMSYAFDYLPGGRDLFVVFNHHSVFDYARAYLPDGRYLYNRGGGFGKYKWDFLNGLTTGNEDQGPNDIDAAAERLATHTRLGLDSLFFGGSITHSRFSCKLSEYEWRALLLRYEELTSRYEKINVGYDFIAEYARSKFETHIARVEADRGEDIVRCSMVGQSSVPLRLYVFEDSDEMVEHRFESIPAFDGRAEVVFGI